MNDYHWDYIFFLRNQGYKGTGTFAGLLGLIHQEYKVVNTDVSLST